MKTQAREKAVDVEEVVERSARTVFSV